MADLHRQGDAGGLGGLGADAVSYTHPRAHETVLDIVCRLLLEKKKNTQLSGRVRLILLASWLSNRPHMRRPVSGVNVRATTQ